MVSVSAAIIYEHLMWHVAECGWKNGVKWGGRREDGEKGEGEEQGEVGGKEEGGVEGERRDREGDIEMFDVILWAYNTVFSPK